MEWLLVQILLSGNWCPSRLSTRTTSVFTIHWISRLCNHITSFTTAMQICTSNSSLFPRPPTPTLQHQKVWQVLLLLIILDRLYCTPNITAVARSCRFPIYIICRMWSFLTKDSVQLLVQARVISSLDYCNWQLAGLPAFVTKSLQRIQNSAAPLFFNLLKFSHVTPLLCDLHWLPVAACLQFKAIQGRQWNCTRLTPNTGQTTRPSKSTSLHYISWPAGTTITENKQLFSVLALQWWNELPTNVRTTESLTIFHKRLKTQDSLVQTPTPSSNIVSIFSFLLYQRWY